MRTKIDILLKFRNGADAEKAEKFVTVKTMMIYEKEADLLKDTKYVSGSRTLLRLHRGLGKWTTLYICISIKSEMFLQILFSMKLENEFNRALCPYCDNQI